MEPGKFLSITVLGLSLISFGVARADDDGGGGHGGDNRGRDQNQPVVSVTPAQNATPATAQLVRLQDTGFAGPASGPVGVDSLTRGRVEVSQNRQARIELVGATPSVSYDVRFCRFGDLPPCMSLSPPNLTTDFQGNAQGQFTFPGSPDNWSGTFVLARGGATEFVSGFQFAQVPAVQMGVQVELKGRIASLSAGNSSFRLEGFAFDIAVSAATRLDDLNSFADLSVGQMVEVTGFSVNTMILATRVKVDND